MIKTQHKIIIGDARKMDEIEDSSVHLIVTSPPYWQLKDYGSDEQIGFNDSYEDYINNLNLTWKECYRVLHPGCKMIINIGDQFARAVYYGRYKIIPIRTEIIKFCETIGFDYMGAIIWQKKTTMNTTGGATVMGSYPFPRNGIIEIDYEFILIFKKPGKAPQVSKEIKQRSIISKEKWKEYFSGHWYFNGARQVHHIAMFPVELPRRAIEMFSFAGDTVLDPFVGSGTTSLASILSNRNSIGYEINEEFLPIIREKLKINENELFRKIDFIVIKQKPLTINWKEKIDELEYVFRDPIKFDKKINPNKLKFGSKINMNDSKSNTKREKYYTVTNIVSPNIIKLSNDLTVRLLGIKPLPERHQQAMEFLKRKIIKRQVYLKFDENKYDKNNNLLVYLYMKNKTFINAHLIKNQYCDLDTEYSFKYREKFTTILKEKLVYENPN